MIKEHEVQNISYTKVNAKSGSLDRFETTKRAIIPTFVPKPNIKAIDVTDVDDESRAELQSLLNEYKEYVQERSKTIFSFADWVEHSKSIDVSDLKWRTFKIDQLEIL